MELTFYNPGADYMIQRIMDFQSEGESAFWTEPLYYFYPQLDKEYANSLPFADRKCYIERIMKSVYAELEGTIDEKVERYSLHWKNCKNQISDALSDAFKVNSAELFNDLRCNISMSPVEPRFLEEHCFDIFYLNSERGAIGGCIHEIIHFYWFYVWNSLFADDYAEYERPSLKWVLSEMVVESIMRDSRLSSINPYFPREHGGCIYPYFFDMEIEGIPILDTIDRMYRAEPIESFMEESYAYCLIHEAEIRNHIRKAEA